MATFECYACHATVQEGMRSCIGCGAELTKAGLEAYRARRSVRAEVERWKFACLVVGIVAFALGMGFGMLSGRTAPVEAAAATVTTAPVHLTLEQANDAFLRSLNETMGLGAVSWVWGADSTMVLELAAPTTDSPGLWQALSADDRKQVMAFISVAYTRALIAAGVEVDLASGHPPIAVHYRGVASPLAVRGRDGAIRVFASPFDRAGPQQPR